MRNQYGQTIIDPVAAELIRASGERAPAGRFGWLAPVAMSLSGHYLERKAREKQAEDRAAFADAFGKLDTADPKSMQEFMIRMADSRDPIAQQMLARMFEHQMGAPERARRREVEDRGFALQERSANRADQQFAETVRMHNEELGLARRRLQATIASNASSAAIAQAKLQETLANQRLKLAEFGQKQAESAQKVRKEYIQNSKEFRGMQDAFAKIERASDTPSGDTGLIFGYMKMLDPESVVREGEQASVQNSAGVPERVRNLYNRLLTGERLSPRQRSEIKNEAGNLFAAQGTIQLALESEYRGIAERNGYAVEDAVPDIMKGFRGKIEGLQAQFVAGQTAPPANPAVAAMNGAAGVQAIPGDPLQGAPAIPEVSQQSMQIAPGGLDPRVGPYGLPPGARRVR